MKTIALGFSVLCCAAILFAWSQPAKASQAVTTCYVIDVATYSDRIHIHCAPPVSGCSLTPSGCPQGAQTQPVYFAVETSGSMASSVVQTGLAALIHKRPLEIAFDDNPGENPAGCEQNDCRRIVGVVLR
jgi:hypothetical protein